MWAPHMQDLSAIVRDGGSTEMVVGVAVVLDGPITGRIIL